MYQFTGVLENALDAEPGVNITVKGLKDRVILAPRGPFHDFDKNQDGNTLTLTLRPSSGTTEGRAVVVEIENGTQETKTNPGEWEVTLTASSDSDPASANITIVYAEDLEEKEEEKK